MVLIVNFTKPSLRREGTLDRLGEGAVWIVLRWEDLSGESGNIPLLGPQTA